MRYSDCLIDQPRLKLKADHYAWFKQHPPTGVHKTGIRGIQDTRQIVDGKTNNKENDDKKGGSRFLNVRQLMKKAI